MRINTLSYGIACFTFLLLSYVFISVGLLPEYSPINSGFADDRNYGNVNYIHNRLKEFSLINNGYWYIANAALYLYPANYFILKFINCILLITCFHLSVNKIFKDFQGIFMLYAFIPSVVLVTKELFILLFFLVFIHIILNTSKNMFKLVGSSILLGAIGMFRYVYIPFVIGYGLLKVRTRSRFLIVAVLIVILIILSNNSSFQGFITKFVFSRFVEMSAEGQNYGLNSQSGSLSAQYSGNLFYSMFQFFTSPVPGVHFYLYNFYYPQTLVLQIATLTLLVNFKKCWVNQKALLLIVFLFVMLIIAINFGSNFRYKYIMIYLLACLVFSTPNLKYANTVILLVISLHVPLITYCVYERF